MSTGPAIGIDLGTTFSCIGVFQDGKVKILANNLGYRKTPSYVAFRDKERIIGDAAKNQAAVNPTHTVFNVKRLIGRRFNDEAVQGDMRRWPFKVINSGERPKIEVKHRGVTKQFTAEEISSVVLLRMKETAEAYLGERVKNAVITVPACFNDSQRQATINAGKIAGLNVMRIINESTAAALAYGLDRRVDRQRNVLIYDLGGGTFNVSIVSIENENFEVKAVGGDTHLGGEDFDSRLVDHCVEMFKQEHKGRDLTTSAKAISRLRKQCENAKRTLSSAERTNIDVESLFEGINFSASITRRCFEQLCLDLFFRTLELAKKALSDAKLDMADVHEVLLVGGSTRIPKVQQLLQNFFCESKLNKSINPDEAAAYGAVLLASSLTDEKPLMLVEVAPHSLDLVTTTLIKRNTKIPTKTSEVFTTSSDYQSSMSFQVYEDGHTTANDNNLLIEFQLSGIPLAPCGVPRVQVTFAIDENGIFDVSAVDKSSRKQIDISIKNRCCLSEDEIEQVLNDAGRLKWEDEKQKSRMAAKIMLEKYIFTIKSKIEDDEVKQETSEEFRENVLTMCDTMLKQIDIDQMATKEDYELMHTKVESVCGPIMAMNILSP
ncbi:Heat shock cognate protein [Echinococcus granulosus]|uniref:Heat shock cognate protein n=1 Tax=Echinococcus granulosus TaxID=6210 RepID=W6U2W8_ECHGR|nr:Heat shock cognate protein [Echinococcus granulosus]EUB54931.1 Heat shock cognate protein [Echinococcus granulosus]